MDRPFTRPLSTADISSSLADLFKQPHPSNSSEIILGLLYHLAETCSKNIGVVHRGITCDGCGTSPIVGTRYHCSECVDVDLCQYCVVLSKHQWSHVLIKIKIPAPLKFSPQWVCESWVGCDNGAITQPQDERSESCDQNDKSRDPSGSRDMSHDSNRSRDTSHDQIGEPRPSGSLGDLSDEEKHTLSAETGIEPNAVQKAWRKFYVLCDERDSDSSSLKSSSFFISHSKLIATYTIVEGDKNPDPTQQNIVRLYNRSRHPSRISFVDFLTVEHWMDSTAPHCELDLVAGFLDLYQEDPKERKAGAKPKRVSRMILLHYLMTLFDTIITQQVWWGANGESRDMEEIVTGPGPVSAKFQEYNDFIRERYFERKPFFKENEKGPMSYAFIEPPMMVSRNSMDNMNRDTPHDSLQAYFGGHYPLLKEMIGMTCGTELMNPLLKILKSRGVIDRKTREIKGDIHILAGDQDAMLLISRIAGLIRKLRG
ncbi:Protein ref(2)P [Yarrowia sp. E02]|nr:Protein ref(2)P [Yarrowia sp. E02]